MRASFAGLLVALMLAMPMRIAAQDAAPSTTEAEAEAEEQPEPSMPTAPEVVESQAASDEPSASQPETSPVAPPPADVASFVWTPGGETPPDPTARADAPGTTWAFEPGAHVIAEYALTFPEGADWNHEFRLSRGWAWLGFRFEGARGRVLLEAVRGSGAGSLFGVAGDSLIVRFREAWVGYRLFDVLELRGGLVPTMLTSALTELWALRAVTSIGLRTFELMAPADLGATLAFDIPEGWGRVAVAYYDGDGYTSRELNRGKTLEVFAELHPLCFVHELAPLTLTLAYQMGSVATTSARADRFIGGLAWNDPRWGVGADVSWLGGIGDRGEREGLLVDGWARVEPIERLLIGAYVSHFIRNLALGTDQLTVLTVAVGARIVEPLRAFLALDGRFADDVAQLAEPGTRGWTVRVVLEGVLGGHFEGVVTP